MSMVALEQRVGMLPKEKVMVNCVPFTNINDMIKQRIGSLLLHEHGSSFHGSGKYVVHCFALAQMD